LQAQLQGLQAQLHVLQATVNNTDNRLTVMQAEKSILFANSQAGPEDILYDPTAPALWLQLAAPNPTTRVELSIFTGEHTSDTSI
jgi:hypothetical protein